MKFVRAISLFLKTSEGYMSLIAPKNMQLIVNYTLYEPTYLISYL